ncbi:S1 RNA-binding domain-containing protein [Actinophytocola oryzae]|uniref:S1 RNA binding family protein n=1 Tax=Actinophytocola oryzae TaxID=502181 RepID=A0A4R7VHW1_9PSEU|nr:S1 RNA-binding domain-containing protein [Actinophytocola oryzae]TDV48946.1 S1 RNA binding family protein [Actinophytocola oryzae]
MSQPLVSSDMWQAFVADIRERSFEATITQLVPFGALVTVGPGIPGLLPASAMLVEPEVGATIAVRVVQIDEQQRRVSLAAT